MGRLRHLIIHPRDNLATALTDLPSNTRLDWDKGVVYLQDAIPAKHKAILCDVKAGEALYMYGVVVARAKIDLRAGQLLTGKNAAHDVQAYSIGRASPAWLPPDISNLANRTFEGYHRNDQQVGTMNYWLVIPLVFCENRNVEVLRDSMEHALGYGIRDQSFNLDPLIGKYQSGATVKDILETELNSLEEKEVAPIFKNVDGLKFLTHEGGCGGIPEDSESLCRLLAAYISNPNVGGATVLSLGCQHAQVEMLQKYLETALPKSDKTVYFCTQQASQSERAFLAQAVKKTFAGLMEINRISRKPAPLKHLTLGLECGGSDGFSGISANPALGYCSDLLVALGGAAVLGEFPELNGMEQNLIDRCQDVEVARRFVRLMQDYNRIAQSQGSGFKDNPSPGNRADGLITDAIKSAGAARKGGTSPVVDVLDYGETVRMPGLHLLCTPGNDVESTTGLAGAGANIIVFTTGLGTPTGNPIAPTIKMSTNTMLADRMTDLIDIDAGSIVRGEESIEDVGRKLMDLIIEVASGRSIPHAVRLGQDDFIPWKRGISL